MKTVYLISTDNEEGETLYKIGFTKRDVEKRIKEMSTGNPYDFIVLETFKSKWATKIERNIHNLYKNKKVKGEWFKLDDEEIDEFLTNCQRYHNGYEAVSKTEYYKLKGNF